MMDLSLLKDKTVLVTGHTGFKGSWMCKVLSMCGANVIGYSLAPVDKINLFDLAAIDMVTTSIVADIRNLEALNKVMQKYRPEIVIHMAAQPIVRESYSNPVYTYETNVMGTVNICEAVRLCDSVKSFVNVTTDKVYRNNEWEWGYRENDLLDGYDPYSNSKSCSELVTSSYIRSFLSPKGIAVSTCRAGNVIGGGDFAKDRIVPDCIRAIENAEDILVRNPYSTRPYQHVLEPVCAYLMVACEQYAKNEMSGSYNVGPDDSDCVTTGVLVDMLVAAWGENAGWKNISENNAPHEAGFLKLDCSKLRTQFHWEPRWNINTAIQKTVEWSKVYIQGGNVVECMEKQIKEYIGGNKWIIR